MRIALITDAWKPQINGVVTTLEQVTTLLRQQGHELLIVHPGQFRTFPLPRYPEIRLAIAPARRLKQQLTDFAPDAIHIATEGTLGFAARRFCLRRRWRFTTSYHTQYAQYGRQYFRIPTRWSYAVLRRFHNAATRMLVPTPSVQRELRSRGFTNAVVWTRGVDTERFRPAAEKNLYHRPRPIFLFCGRVAREKNIEAFLHADLPGTKVVIGDGPAMASLRPRHPRVVFTGFQTGDDLARHMAAGDVFVFPSRTDTFGVVMLEAMACGLPVAAYPVTGPIDVVRPGVTGVLHEDIAIAAMQALLLDPRDCRAQALECSWDRCAAMFLDNLVPRAA